MAITIHLSTLDGTNGFRLDGLAAYDGLGNSVSNAGDVNGDGYDDLLVGAPGDDSNGYNSGSCYVVFGKASSFDALLDLSSLDGNNGFRLDVNGSTVNSVSNAGDVNGDGFDDLIIGGIGYSSSSSYVVFGKASNFNALLDLSILDGHSGFRLDMEYDPGVVSTAGDVNGDGFDDLIIGASKDNINGSLSGSSYVIFGKASGFDASFDLSAINGSNGFRVDGLEEDDRLGYSVSNAGDVNGDGLDDIIIGNREGAMDYDSYNWGAGSSYIIFGKISGFDASLDLASLDGSNGFCLDGVFIGDQLGRSVSGAGDINGDGFDDLIIGAPLANPSGMFNAGSSYVVFGRSDFSGGNVMEGTPRDDTLQGTPAADIFEAGDGNDILIGGSTDVFYGDAGDDNIRVADLSFGLVDGGSGNNVLHLVGSNLNLDLANFDDEKISGIETICLYGVGDNTLTLTTAADVLNLSWVTNTLKVNGNAGDRVVLKGDWVDEGSRGSGYYHVYTQDDAVLLIGMNLATDFV